MTTPISVAHCLYLSAFYLAGCAWVGIGLLTLLFRGAAPSGARLNGHLWLFFVLAGGMALHFPALFIVGLVGRLDVPGMAASSAVLLVLSAIIVAWFGRLPDRWRQLMSLRPSWPSAANGLSHAMLLAGLLGVIASLAERAPGHWDDTSYHLAYAQFYLDHRQLQINEYLRFPLFPHHMDLLFAFGLAHGGVVFAQAMATLPLFIIAVGLIGAARQFLGSVVPGLVATWLLIYLGPISGTLGYAYVDNGLALFCWAALLALLQPRFAGNDNGAWVLFAAVLAATAAGIKPFGTVWAGLLFVFVLLESRRLRPALAYASVVAVFGSWWYIRSMWISGDPIHPAGGSLFGYFLWNKEDLLAQKHQFDTFRIGGRLGDWLPTVVGAQVSLIVPAFLAPLWFRRSDCSLIYAYGVFVSYFVFWFYVVPIDRYLAPLLALGAFFTVFAIFRVGKGTLPYRLVSRWPPLHTPVAHGIAVVCLLVLLLPLALNQAQSNRDNWSSVLESRPGYELLQDANALIPEKGPRLVQLGFENGVFFYRGVMVGDWFGPGRYSQFTECTAECRVIAPATMIEMMAKLDSRMLLINTRRFAIDLDAYRWYFDIHGTAKDGYLLTIKG